MEVGHEAQAWEMSALRHKADDTRGQEKDFQWLWIFHGDNSLQRLPSRKVCHGKMLVESRQTRRIWMGGSYAKVDCPQRGTCNFHKVAANDGHFILWLVAVLYSVGIEERKPHLQSCPFGDCLSVHVRYPWTEKKGIQKVLLRSVTSEFLPYAIDRQQNGNPAKDCRY